MGDKYHGYGNRITLDEYKSTAFYYNNLFSIYICACVF